MVMFCFIMAFLGLIIFLVGALMGDWGIMFIGLCAIVIFVVVGHDHKQWKQPPELKQPTACVGCWDA